MVLCAICKTQKELRPFGLNAALICFPCMKADPTLEAHATSVVGKMMAGDGHMVIDSGGLRKPTYLEAVLIQELSELSSSPEVK
jgi:hypothetical protein